jgi:uncharacterized protein (TIGR02996 family)
VIPAELLSAVADHPAEVGPRLLCIDWLIEYGTEGEWQSYLDRFPDHHDMRARFGLFLSERGDMRGEGYAALARLRVSPTFDKPAGRWMFFKVGVILPLENSLPSEWFNALTLHPRLLLSYFSRRSRAALENEAVGAFAAMPEKTRAKMFRKLKAADRRAELLRGTGAPVA